MTTSPIAAARVKLAELFAWQSIHDSHLNVFVEALNHAEKLAAALAQAESTCPQATPEEIHAARKACACSSGDNVEVRRDAPVIRGEDGAWVQAWVWVHNAN